MPTRVSVAPSPRPCAAGSTPTTYTSPRPGFAACTLVQWNPSSFPVLLVERHEQSAGVEPRLGAALGDVGGRPPALLGVPGERGVVDPQQFGVVVGSGVGGDAHIVGNAHRRQVGQRATHLQQLAHHGQAERGRHRARRLEVAVRPDAGAGPALGQSDTRHRRADAAAPGPRMHDQLGQCGRVGAAGARFRYPTRRRPPSTASRCRVRSAGSSRST